MFICLLKDSDYILVQMPLPVHIITFPWTVKLKHFFMYTKPCRLTFDIPVSSELNSSVDRQKDLTALWKWVVVRPFCKFCTVQWLILMVSLSVQHYKSLCCVSISSLFVSIVCSSMIDMWSLCVSSTPILSGGFSLTKYKY